MTVRLGSAYGMINLGFDGGGVRSALTALGGLTQTVQFVGGAINQYLLRPLAAIGREAVATASDFESQMAIMSTAVDTTKVSMDTMHDAALAVGEDTRLMGVSASGAAEAITGMLKAGLDVSDVFGDVNAYLEEGAELGGALRSAIDLAAASELDMVQASDLVAVSMATFGLEASEASRIADSFVKAADASVAEVSELAEAMTTVGPTAASFGWSLEEVNTALGILSQRGIRGAEAGTNLKSMMTNLMRPTDDVKEALKELGVTLFDSEGQMRSLPDIIGQLEKALYGEVEVLTEVGGRTKEQEEELDRLKSMYAGAAQQLADYEAGIRGTGMTEKARQKRMEALRIEMENMLPLIQDLDAIQGDYVKSTKELTEAERLEYIQTLAGSYGKNAMNTLLAEGVEGWEAMVQAIEDASSVQEIAAARSDTFKGAMEGLDGVIETLKIRVGERLLPELTEMVRWFSDFVAEQSPKVEDAVGAVVDWLSVKLPEAIALVSSFWQERLLPALTTAWGYIKENVIPVLSDVWSWLKQQLPIALATLSRFWSDTLVPSMQKAWAFIQDSVIPALSDIWSWLQEKTPGAIQTLSDFWSNTLLPAIQAVWTFIQANIVPILAGLVALILGIVVPAFIVWAGSAISAAVATISALAPVLLPILAIGAAVGLLVAAWQNNWGGIRDALTTVWEQHLKPTLETLWAWLQESIPVAIQALSDFWNNTLLPAIQAVWAFITESLIPALSDIWTWISEKVSAGIEALSTLWTETLLPALNDVWAFVQEYLLPLFTALGELFVTIGAKVSEFVVAFWEGILLPALETVWAFLVENLKPVWEDLKQLWEDLQPVIQTIADIIGTTLTEAWGKAMEKMNVLKDDILPKLKTAWDNIKTAIEKVTEWIQTLIDMIGSIEIPEWLQGHSPPPLANWFTDIAEAMGAVAEIGDLPALSAPVRMAMQPIPAPAAVGAGVGGGQRITELSIPPGMVHVDRVGDEVDVHMLAYEVATEIERRLRR